MSFGILCKNSKQIKIVCYCWIMSPRPYIIYTSYKGSIEVYVNTQSSMSPRLYIIKREGIKVYVNTQSSIPIHLLSFEQFFFLVVVYKIMKILFVGLYNLI